MIKSWKRNPLFVLPSNYSSNDATALKSPFKERLIEQSFLDGIRVDGRVQQIFVVNFNVRNGILLPKLF